MFTYKPQCAPTQLFKKIYMQTYNLIHLPNFWFFDPYVHSKGVPIMLMQCLCKIEPTYTIWFHNNDVCKLVGFKGINLQHHYCSRVHKWRIMLVEHKETSPCIRGGLWVKMNSNKPKSMSSTCDMWHISHIYMHCYVKSC
jgi:hypothetical protein